MTDKEIIKALECCISPECENCPYDGDDLLRPCNHNLMKDALDLINRQQAEINELKHERDVLLEDIHHSADQINEQIKVIERLKKGWIADVIETENIKANAIKEYIETCEKTAISNAAKVAKAKFLEMVGEQE